MRTSGWRPRSRPTAAYVSSTRRCWPRPRPHASRRQRKQHARRPSKRSSRSSMPRCALKPARACSSRLARPRAVKCSPGPLDDGSAGSSQPYALVLTCMTSAAAAYAANDPVLRQMQLKHEQSKNSFSKEQRRVWQDKCVPQQISTSSCCHVSASSVVSLLATVTSCVPGVMKRIAALAGSPPKRHC